MCIPYFSAVVSPMEPQCMKHSTPISSFKENHGFAESDYTGMRGGSGGGTRGYVPEIISRWGALGERQVGAPCRA